MEPITRKVTFSCTPRVCNSFNLPYFNIGTKDHPKWIQVGRAGDIIEARDPQEFIPISTNKADQIVLQQAGIYSKKQEEEFKRFTLMRDARDLIQNELFLKMFSEPNLAALDTSLATPTFLLHGFVSDKLQQIFLPWPLSLLHLLPDWVVLSGLMIVILVLIKLFFRPCISHLPPCQRQQPNPD